MQPTEQTAEPLRSLQESFGPQIEEARRNLGDLNTKVVKFIREHPGTCLLGALAVGFVVGRIASRR
jgi:hypothetical protein